MLSLRVIYVYSLDRINSSRSSEEIDCKTIALCLNGRHMLQLLVPSASAISLAPAARSTPDGTGKVDIEGRRSERIYTYDILPKHAFHYYKRPRTCSHTHTRESYAITHLLAPPCPQHVLICFLAHACPGPRLVTIASVSSDLLTALLVADPRLT